MVTPLAVAPEDLPPITNPEEALRQPELAVLTAPAHADGPEGEAVVRSYCEAIGSFDRETGKLYHDYAVSLFSETARDLLEEIMKVEDYQWQSDFALKHQAIGKAEGRAEGEATLILRVLRGARDLCLR